MTEKKTVLRLLPLAVVLALCVGPTWAETAGDDFDDLPPIDRLPTLDVVRCGERFVTFPGSILVKGETGIDELTWRTDEQQKFNAYTVEKRINHVGRHHIGQYADKSQSPGFEAGGCVCGNLPELVNVSRGSDRLSRLRKHRRG